MPGRDETGPNGFGPGSGRGMGPCQVGNAAQPMTGCGRGRGYRWQYYATGKPSWMRHGTPINPQIAAEYDSVQEKTILEQQIKNTELHLEQLKERLKQSEK